MIFLIQQKFFAHADLKKRKNGLYFYPFFYFVEIEAEMKFYMTDGFDSHSGMVSAVPLSSFRIPAPIDTTSDALIAIIISQAAR